MELNRETLQEIREEAWELSQVEGTNEGWQRAYLRLFDACNEIDAFIGRSSAGVETDE